VANYSERGSRWMTTVAIGGVVGAGVGTLLAGPFGLVIGAAAGGYVGNRVGKPKNS